MSVQEKLDQARALLEEHNGVVGEASPGYVDTDKFISCLMASGATSEARLRALSYEEILGCMPETDGPKPVVLAKQLANEIFRGGGSNEANASGSGGRTKPIGRRKAESMSNRGLVEHFDPERHTTAVGKELKARAKRKRFLVYVEGRQVDVEASVQLLDAVSKGFPEVDKWKGPNDPKHRPVYKVGELPPNLVDENPLFPGSPLFPGGLCHVLQVSWEGVDKQIRQLVRLIQDSGQIEDDQRARDIAFLAHQPEAMKKLRERYPDQSVQFDELERTQKLPSLLVEVGTDADEEADTEERVSSPFDRGRPVDWPDDGKGSRRKPAWFVDKTAGLSAFGTKSVTYRARK